MLGLILNLIILMMGIALLISVIMFFINRNFRIKALSWWWAFIEDFLSSIEKRNR